MRILAVLLVGCASMMCQTRSAPTFECHVYAVNIKEAQEAVNRHLDSPAAARDAAIAKVELLLGRFSARIGEEVTTTRSFSIPGTTLQATATVFFTDESMTLAESVWQGLYVGEKRVQNALTAVGAAITEVNYDLHTFKVLTKQRLSINRTPWVVGLQCQSMSDDERRKRLQAPADLK